MYLTQGFHRSLQQTPDAVMTIYKNRARTFGEVGERVARLAGALQGIGVSPGDRVAILALNSDRYSELLLAVPWADAVLNPVNTRWSAAEIVFSLDDCQTAVLVVDDAFASLVPALRSAHPGLKSVIYCGEGPTPDGMLDYERLIAESDAVGDARRGGDALAGLFYTGGTTGFPKGVMLSHANLVTSALGAGASRALFRSGGTYLHVAPMFHLADFTGWNVQLLVGGTHVMVPSFDVRMLLEVIERNGVTGMTLVPAMIQAIVDDPATADFDLGSVETILYGASPISETLLKRAMAAFPSAGFTQAYGMTELAGLATFLTPEDHAEGIRLRSAGRAIPHTEVKIIDSAGAEPGPGCVGEVVVRGGHVMQGYWNRPDETTAAIDAGWMRTGDAGYMDHAGYLYVVDRIKDMIVTGGENVYSAEVENALSSHPAVVECAVIGLPDERWGERVHGVVVLHADAETTAQELRDHVKSLIAGYKAPRSFEFTPAIPRTAAGKILKRTLREEYLADVPRR
ncbi:acyl-CoA synthetase (AMP-forming)/AMP-acid ligase II [Actinocorallia herbida]|uniref:Acyl-CoA synthetase (AMP-forming)/AMP-acid ligase II n=1 Tax=Actinocorallia herbida TaxID=58109 RepID=A0A3N1D2V9_9ACTN|nr:long-chain-fatty-acid--CoA ligase [Actinocorallia herbida]ROO87859.1 acyl-CoA synthetase (AMP-forming)/AMP-acid ligase II [Actinocorallia herbida]